MPRISWLSIILLLLAAGGASAAAEAPIPFDEALDRIVERSTGVAVERANLGATQARSLQAAFAFVPSLSFDASQSWGRALDTTTLQQQVEAVSQLNLFHWGADFQGLKAAHSDESSEEQLVLSSELRAEEAGARALFNEILSVQEVAIDEDIVKLQSELHRIALQRYKSGLLPLQEADRVSVDLDIAQATLADDRIREVAARASLESLLGASRVAPEWPWRDLLPRIAARRGSWPKFEPDLKPDWRAARARADAEEHRYQRNKALFLPSLDGSFAYGYPRFALSGSPQWTATLSITLPFLDHLVTYSNARAQFYAWESSQAQLTQAERDARADWDTWFGSFDTAVQTALTRDHTLEVSRRLYHDNLKRFQAGRVAANDLAQDQSRVFSSETLALQGWSAAHLAFVRFCHAMGKRVRDCAA